MEGGGGLHACWQSAAVKFCCRQAQTLFSSYAGHMFTGINLGPESRLQDIFTVCAGVILLVTGTDHRDIGQDFKTLSPSPRDVSLY